MLSNGIVSDPSFFSPFPGHGLGWVLHEPLWTSANQIPFWHWPRLWTPHVPEICNLPTKSVSDALNPYRLLQNPGHRLQQSNHLSLRSKYDVHLQLNALKPKLWPGLQCPFQNC
eukprot:TRINITY_DN19444_c0_g1_i1.p2 TRINITY_DN19444_c0_g1~~TRINITY_DN19444_c0_g1_i1.p2  ORF type:complete len:114 (+),score=12.97 TRINITY_DN19444_c0_g1_i1:133-474(+)